MALRSQEKETLTRLGNAKDKASAKAAAGADLKEKLNGEKTIAEKHEDEVAGAAKLGSPAPRSPASLDRLGATSGSIIFPRQPRRMRLLLFEADPP